MGEPLENSEIEHSSTNEIYQKYYDDDETHPHDPSPILWKTNVLNFKRDLVLDQIIKAMDKASAPHRKS